MKAVWITLMLLLARAMAEEPLPAKLPEGTAKVAVVLYDFAVDRDRPAIEVDGKLHPGIVPGYTKYLNGPQTDKLLKALTQNHAQKDRFWCDFAPHHGVLFQAQDGKILGSVSICFRCSEIHSKTFPKIGTSFYSYWGWSELREVIAEAGLPIVGSNEEYTALRLAKVKEPAGVKPGSKSESDATGP